MTYKKRDKTDHFVDASPKRGPPHRPHNPEKEG